VTDHEYSVVGHSRSQIGRYLAIAAALASSALVALGTWWSQIVVQFGLPPWSNFVATPVSAAAIYVSLHFLFNKWGWCIAFYFLGLPNISGTWACSGETRGDDNAVIYEWNGTVTISQTWEKIRVTLRTEQSSSRSVSAALIPDGDRWMLMYSYRNEPRAGEPLNPHLGYCELSFLSKYKRAEGDYFTARGRGSFGRMTLERV